MLNIFIKSLDKEQSYRQKQALSGVFKQLAENWSQVKSLPKNLQQKLECEFPLEINAKITAEDEKSVIKALIELQDKKQIEAVLMKHGDGRHTVCVSSQVGCPVGCLFCATGKMGFLRNLTSWEIIKQVLFFERMLKKQGKNVTNVVFMGMGEPMLNFENVIESALCLNSDEGLKIGARKISISTSGIVEGIEKLAQIKKQFNLAISLHAPDNKLRSEIMPINKKYPIEKILKTADSYINSTGRQVMFEYLLINEINDSKKCALALSRLMQKKLYFLNLIVFNPIKDSSFIPSTPERIKEFKKILDRRNIKYSQRYRFGSEVNAACGQLATGNSKTDLI